MANIMADVHLADAYAQTVYKSDTLLPRNNLSKNIDTLKLYTAKVFALHNITEAKYMEQLKLYASKAPLYDSLYSLTQKRLEKIRPKTMH